MPGMNDLSGEQRAARARMEQAEKAASARQEVLPRRPRRYKLYDRIKDKVSVTTMNVIIGATVLLLVLALVIGIATGNPQ